MIPYVYGWFYDPMNKISYVFESTYKEYYGLNNYDCFCMKFIKFEESAYRYFFIHAIILKLISQEPRTCFYL